ncbi:MAG: alpha/beta hydrolase [Rhizobiaceae bacterium]|nr:alpha/beta hydrolase [Rhizobiaceae bacterium]
MGRLFVVFCLLFVMVQAHAREFSLAPFKDDLFAYPKILDRSSDGSYVTVEYNRDRDLVNRDQVLRWKAHHKYVDRGVRWSRSVSSYVSANGKFKYFSVGKANSKTAVSVIYVHGKGGNRRQGVNDWTFGGNFNRLQNLMTHNRGVLYTPDFTDFTEQGTVDVAALIQKVRKKTPAAKLIVACGSMGGGVCWRLAKKSNTASQIDGLFLLGSHWHDDFLKSPVVKKSTRNIPIYIGHGSKDPVFKPSVQFGFYKKIRAKNSKYPIRFVMFDSGAHGTPIRMVDWRHELNWMLSLN